MVSTPVKLGLHSTDGVDARQAGHTFINGAVTDIMKVSCPLFVSVDRLYQAVFARPYVQVARRIAGDPDSALHLVVVGMVRFQHQVLIETE